MKKKTENKAEPHGVHMQGQVSGADGSRIIVGSADVLSSRQMKWAVTFLLVYFGLRLLFFSLTIDPYVPPDEATHFGISTVFSHTLLFPQNSPDSYQFGLVTNIPWLYYWVMGRLLSMNFFGIADLQYLRVLNIPFAFVTLYFVWRTLRLLTDDRLSQLLVIVAMTNTLMFSFLSSFVSYDNLTNLLAAMAIYYLIAFFKNPSGDLLITSFLCQLGGSLAKLSFLPLLLILNVLLGIYVLKHRSLLFTVPEWFKTLNVRRAGLLVGILISMALNIQLYAGNYLRYGAIDPGMAQVLSPEIAMQNRLAARDLIFSQFREGRISAKQAIAMTARMQYQSDRDDTIQFITDYWALQNNLIPWPGMTEYLANWIMSMPAGIYGIYAHYHMLNIGSTMWPFIVLGLLTALGIVLRWRPSDASWLPTCLIAIALSYGLFLLVFVNYPAFRSTGYIGFTLHGRYLFPILGAFYPVCCYYLPRLFSNRTVRLTLVVAACLVFLAFDLPFFLANVTSGWFIPSLRG